MALSSQTAVVIRKDSQPVVSSGAAIVYAVSVIMTRIENRILMSPWRVLDWIEYQKGVFCWFLGAFDLTGSDNFFVGGVQMIVRWIRFDVCVVNIEDDYAFILVGGV